MSGTIGQTFTSKSGLINSNEVRSTPGGSFWGLKVTNGASTLNSGIQFAHSASNVRFNVFLNAANDYFHIMDNGFNNGVYIANNADSWTSGTSDERKKTDWSGFTDAVGKINTLTKIGTFRKIDPVSKDYINGDKTNIGISAQEVQKILPSAVDTMKPQDQEREDKDVEYLTLNYQDVFVMAIKAIQELSTENTELKTKMESLEARVSALEKE